MTREEEAIATINHILEATPKEPPIGCDYADEWLHEDTEIRKALNMAIEALKQKSVLDKIRAEIKEMTPTYHNPDWSITDLVSISEILKLIDKCATESEVNEFKKLFLVTFNGYHFDGYGSEIYLLGVYSSREEAEKACDKAEVDMKAMSDEYDTEIHKPTINEVELDNSKLIFENDHEFKTDVCLGGYAE